jgi:hypothetical protein
LSIAIIKVDLNIRNHLIICWEDSKEIEDISNILMFLSILVKILKNNEEYINVEYNKILTHKEFKL